MPRSWAAAALGLLLALVAMQEASCISKGRTSIGDVNIDPEPGDDDYDEWKKAWETPKKKKGKGARPAPPPPPGAPPGLEGMDMSKMMGGGMGGMMGGGGGGPKLVFARLRDDPTGKRTQKDVEKIASMWTGLMKTGGLAESLFAIDEDTVLISVADEKDMEEVKDFVLSQDDGYEFEVNGQKFRRPGDPPLPTKAAPPPPPKDDKPTKNKKQKKAKKAKKGKDEL